MKSKKLLLLFVTLCLIVSGCVGNIVITANPIVPTKTEQPEFTATNTVQVNTNTHVIPSETATPTLEPKSTETPLPTIDKHPPTPTVERPVEWDIKPFYEKKVDTEWKGVRIKANIIIDESLKDRIKSIEMMDSLLAEIVARTIFVAWYSQYSQVVWDKYYSTAPGNRELYYDETAFDSFMELWAKAQKTGDASNWHNVQINNIWANDLADGNGYVPQPYSFWPMFEGEPSLGVRVMREYTYVFTDSRASNNISMVRYSDGDVSSYLGFGKNITEDSLIFIVGNPCGVKVGISSSLTEDYFEENAAEILTLSLFEFLYLHGEEYVDAHRFFIDESLNKSIEHWGIKIKLP